MPDESYADLRIRIYAYDEARGAYPVEAHTDDERDYNGALRIDRQALLAAELDPETYGLTLFDALFTGAIGRAYHVATGRAEAAHKGRVRVRMQIDPEAAELHALSWERLYHYHRGQAVPMATSTLTPFSRYTVGETATAPPLREGPVRMLYALSNPGNLREQGLTPLDIGQEIDTLLQALGDLRRSQRVEVTVLPGHRGLAAGQRQRLDREGYLIQQGPTTLEALLRHLPGQHILHFVGHGFLERKKGRRSEVTAVLCLEHEDGTLHRVPDRDIVPGLANIAPLPYLIFLAACEAAKQSADATAQRAAQPAGAEHPLVGLAPKLARAGVPAVVAMQDRVLMDVARQLTGEFYRRLLEHGVVDRALNEARALLFNRDDVDWAIPVFFSRLRTGQLFLLPHPRRPGDVVLRAPSPPGEFAGRANELKRLAAILRRDGGTEIRVAIQGMGGLGKSALALALGRALEPAFPGGVLWVDAGQEGSKQEAREQEAEGREDDVEVRAGAIVDHLALKLDLDLKAEPQLAVRAAIVQNTLARRGRLLIILDDLLDAGLGHWLLREALPAERALLITSRDLIVCQALCAPANVEDLGVLPEPEALELLANYLGDLAHYESQAKEIVRLLGSLPLALRLAAGLCIGKVGDLPWLLRQLKDKPTLDILRLEGREEPESSVEACLALSYKRLSDDEQRRFRALGVFAPAPFDLAALAAVWGDNTTDAAEDAARTLVRRGLLVRAEEQLVAGKEPPPYPVYGQHRLLRAYALALLRRAGEEAAPTGRQTDHYQALAGADWSAGERFWEQVEHAWEWAWEAGPKRALAFYYGMGRFLELRGRAQPHIEWISSLLESPVEGKERATLLNSIGRVYSAMGDKQRALEFYEQALPLFRQDGDRFGEARTLNNIGELHRSLGVVQLALEFYNRALPIFHEVGGDRSGEAAALNNIGLVYNALGQNQRALEFLNQALPLFRQVDDRSGEARTLNNIGLVYNILGQKQRARDEFYNQALTLFRQVGDRSGEATTLNNIGRVYDALGEVQRALEFYNEALPLRRHIGDRGGEAVTLNNIGLVYSALGKKHCAVKLYEQALPIFRQVGDRSGEAKTLHNIGSAYDDLGEKQRALEFYNEALPLYQRVRDRWSELVLRRSIIVHATLEQPEAIEEQLLQVVALDEALGHPDLESDRAALAQVQAMRRARDDAP